MPGHEAARVEMAADGSVACYVSFPSQGQGHATTTAQLVADQLGVPLEAVDVRQPDTRDRAGRHRHLREPRRHRPERRGRRGGRHACGAKLLAIAGALLEASPADLVLRDGRVTVRGMPDRGVSVAEVARLACAPPPGGLPAGLEPGLEATQAFDPPGPTFSGAVHVAAVEVDAETGRVTVRDYTVVEDCGPVINPDDRRGPDPRRRGPGHRRGAGRAPRLRRERASS